MKIPVMNDQLTFGEAFTEARKVSALKFDWRGKTYTTELYEEVKKEIDPKILNWR